MKSQLYLSAIALSLCSTAIAKAADAIDGKQAFKALCTKCHGDSGTGTFMLSRRLGKDKSLLETRTDLSPEFIRHVVRNGIVSMPPLTRVEVSDDELRAITQYLTKPNQPR